MRIAYDITQTGNDKAGCGYFAYSLIRALSAIDHDNEYLLLDSFGGQNWDGEVSSEACGIRQYNFTLGSRDNDAPVKNRFWHSLSPELEKKIGEPDIVHANNFYCPTGLLGSRLVYTLYDLSFIDHPEWSTEANRKVCFDGVYHASLYADSILAISQNTRNDFLRIFPHYNAEKVRVIYPASRYNKLPTPLNKPTGIPTQVTAGRFWLCVGTLEPRKNHLGLLKAYAQHKARTWNALPLVHAGGPGWLMDDFKSQIHKLNLDDSVILLGYVDDTTIQWLYQNCFAFIYPSFFEGFGMPVLEAMSQGSAVIASNTTSIPEIIGDAGILVDPSDDTQIANAMDELTGDKNRLTELKLAGIAKADSFSWNKAAQETLKLYRHNVG